MGFKYNNIIKLRSMCLNTFDSKLVTDLADLDLMSDYTIRFDTAEKSKTKLNLPCYIIKGKIKNETKEEIKEYMSKHNSELLCTKAINLMRIQKYNAVINVNLRTGEYILEYNYDKCILRDMYNENLITVEGNLYRNKYRVIRGTDPNVYDVILAVKGINLFRPEFDNKSIELTTFSEPVGRLFKHTVVWQVV